MHLFALIETMPSFRLVTARAGHTSWQIGLEQCMHDNDKKYEYVSSIQARSRFVHSPLLASTTRRKSKPA